MESLSQYVLNMSVDVFHFLLGAFVSWIITRSLYRESLLAKQEVIAARQEVATAKEEQIQHLKKLIEAGDRDLAWFQREYQLLQQALGRANY